MIKETQLVKIRDIEYYYQGVLIELNLFMKEYSLEVPASPETDIERLSKKAVDIILNARNAVGVEIYDEGYGIAGAEGISDEEVAAQAAATYEEYRARLAELVADLSFEREALSVYDVFVANGKTAEEAVTEMKRLFLHSEEQQQIIEELTTNTKEELDAIGVELNDFIETKIITNEDRASRSKWGNAKLDYEKGNSNPLQLILKELSSKAEDATEKDLVQTFLHFLKHQKFESK